MKTALALFLILLGVGQAAPPTADETALIKKDIGKIFDESKVYQADTVIKKTHPALVKLVGGQKAFEKMILEGMKELQKQGVEFVSFKIGEPGDLFPVGKEHFCFVPTTGVLKLKETSVETQGYMIAIRNPDGKTWSYLDGAGFKDDVKKLTELFPNFPQDTKLPEHKTKIL